MALVLTKTPSTAWQKTHLDLIWFTSDSYAQSWHRKIVCGLIWAELQMWSCDCVTVARLTPKQHWQLKPNAAHRKLKMWASFGPKIHSSFFAVRVDWLNVNKPKDTDENAAWAIYFVFHKWMVDFLLMLGYNGFTGLVHLRWVVCNNKNKMILKM